MTDAAWDSRFRDKGIMTPAIASTRRSATFFATTIAGAAILLSFSALPARAAVRYISPSGSASNSGSSPAAPWDLSKANSSLVAGDVCYVLPGSYSGSISPSNSGAAGSRISVIGDISNPTASSFSGGVSLVNRHYVTIKGVSVDGGVTVSSSDGSSGSRSREDSVLYVHAKGSLSVSAFRCHVLFSRIGDGIGSDRWVMYGPNGGGTALATECTIRNNVFNLRTDLTSTHAIRFDAISLCEFSGNKVAITVGPGASDSHARIFYGVNNCVFRDNRLDVTNLASYTAHVINRDGVQFNTFERDSILMAENSTAGVFIRFATSGSFPGSCGYNTYVNGFYKTRATIDYQNNVNGDKMFGCTFIGLGQAMTFAPQSSYVWNDSLEIRHCTFYSAGGSVVDMNNATNFILRSNIFYSVGSACPGVELPNTSVDSDSNLFYQAAGNASNALSAGGGCGSIGPSSSWCSSVGSECRSQWGDPKFVNATYAGFDPRLSTGSLAVGSQWKDGYVGAIPPGGVITDQTPPGTVGDLRMDQITDQGGLLAWTAPGDDGSNGRATAYDMRISAQPITDLNFNQAQPLAATPQPDSGGLRQTYVMLGYTPGSTWFIAMKAVDEVGNWSGLSNVLTLVTHSSDATPSDAIQDLSVGASSN
jgi:hypothetical protein